MFCAAKDGSFETKLEVVKEADTLYLRLLPVFGDAATANKHGEFLPTVPHGIV